MKNNKGRDKQGRKEIQSNGRRKRKKEITKEWNLGLIWIQIPLKLKTRHVNAESFERYFQAGSFSSRDINKLVRLEWVIPWPSSTLNLKRNNFQRRTYTSVVRKYYLIDYVAFTNDTTVIYWWLWEVVVIFEREGKLPFNFLPSPSLFSLDHSLNHPLWHHPSLVHASLRQCNKGNGKVCAMPGVTESYD